MTMTRYTCMRSPCDGAPRAQRATLTLPRAEALGMTQVERGDHVAATVVPPPGHLDARLTPCVQAMRDARQTGRWCADGGRAGRATGRTRRPREGRRSRGGPCPDGRGAEGERSACHPGTDLQPW